MNARLADKASPGKGVILLWRAERRIIAHADLLRRLFEGVFSSPSNPERGSLRGSVTTATTDATGLDKHMTLAADQKKEIIAEAMQLARSLEVAVMLGYLGSG
jgi:hypothetical protein